MEAKRGDPILFTSASFAGVKLSDQEPYAWRAHCPECNGRLGITYPRGGIWVPPDSGVGKGVAITPRESEAQPLDTKTRCQCGADVLMTAWLEEE